MADEEDDEDIISNYQVPSDENGDAEDVGDLTSFPSDITADTSLIGIPDLPEGSTAEDAHNAKFKKGEWLKGMDVFDAASQEDRRKRNQRKDPSVLAKMQHNSGLVAQTETVCDLQFNKQRERNVYDEPSIDGSGVGNFLLPTWEDANSAMSRMRTKPHAPKEVRNLNVSRPREANHQSLEADIPKQLSCPSQSLFRATRVEFVAPPVAGEAGEAGEVGVGGPLLRRLAMTKPMRRHLLGLLALVVQESTSTSKPSPWNKHSKMARRMFSETRRFPAEVRVGSSSSAWHRNSADPNSFSAGHFGFSFGQRS